MIEVEFGGEMHPGSFATPGGRQLKALRQRHGLTQLEVELSAGLGTGYLQRLESGRVRQPSRTTLGRLLDALQGGFTEQREILELFGYLVSVNPPVRREIDWAIGQSRADLDEFPFPAYVLDCLHRLIAWNPRFPRLLDPSGDSVVANLLEGHSLPAAWFDPDSPLSQVLANPETFHPALIRAFRYEMRQFQHEPWFEEVLQSLFELETFRHVWQQVELETGPAGAARALVPLQLNVYGSPELRFRLSAETFTRDSRFRIVFYFPADRRTMEVCSRWVETSGTGDWPAET